MAQFKTQNFTFFALRTVIFLKKHCIDLESKFGVSYICSELIKLICYD